LQKELLRNGGLDIREQCI